MTHLRKMMLEELERRDYAQTTTSSYIRTIEDFARYFRRPPDQLAPEHIREYQAHLFRVGGLLETTFRRPRVCAPLSRPLHPSCGHLNHRLVSLVDDQVTFRWRDRAHNNQPKL